MSLGQKNFDALAAKGSVMTNIEETIYQSNHVSILTLTPLTTHVADFRDHG
jgi:hypothetical protein